MGVSLNAGSARAWRAPNHPQISLVSCSALDDLAAKCGMDSLQFFLKNVDLTNKPDVYTAQFRKAAEMIEWSKYGHARPDMIEAVPIKRGLGHRREFLGRTGARQPVPRDHPVRWQRLGGPRQSGPRHRDPHDDRHGRRRNVRPRTRPGVHRARRHEFSAVGRLGRLDHHRRRFGLDAQSGGQCARQDFRPSCARSWAFRPINWKPWTGAFSPRALPTRDELEAGLRQNGHADHFRAGREPLAQRSEGRAHQSRRLRRADGRRQRRHGNRHREDESHGRGAGLRTDRESAHRREPGAGRVHHEHLLGVVRRAQ